MLLHVLLRRRRMMLCLQLRFRLLLLLLLLLGAFSYWTISPSLFEYLWPCPAQRAAVGALTSVAFGWLPRWVGLHRSWTTPTRRGCDTCFPQRPPQKSAADQAWIFQTRHLQTHEISRLRAAKGRRKYGRNDFQDSGAFCLISWAAGCTCTVWWQ